MTKVTQLLSQIEQGDAKAGEELLPLLYDELRKLAAGHIQREKPGHTLQPTALVHEAYLRLIGPADEKRWDNRGHFFAAAAEAMRRILIESARRKQSLRRGGEFQRIELPVHFAENNAEFDNLVDLSDALDELTKVDSQAAELVKLHYFAGLTMEQAAAVIGVSTRKAYNVWSFARAWLFRAMGGKSSEQP